MDAIALLLSRLQFAFTISFHIIIPSFTIGLSAWLTVQEALNFATGRPTYRVVFEFWLKIFAVAFGFGVVSGIVMALQFGKTGSVLARKVGIDFRGAAFYEIFTPFSSRQVSLAFFSWDALAFRPGSICCRPRWWRWAPRFRHSGSWSTTAGCRRPSVMRSKTVNSSRPTGPRSSSVRFFGCVSPICSRFLPHRRLLRRSERGLVPAAWEIPRRSAHHAAHGSHAGSRARTDPNVVRTLEWGIGSSPPAGEDGRDRGAMARREARL